MNLKIFLNERRQVIKFDTPLKFHDSKILIKTASVFWDYNNITEDTIITHGSDQIVFETGYWTANQIQLKLKKSSVNLKLNENSLHAKITPSKNLNLKTLGNLLGFAKDTEILAGISKVSPKPVDVNLGLHYLNIHCFQVNGRSRTYWNGKRSDVLCTVPITSQQTLKSSVTTHELNTLTHLDSGIFNELTFYCENFIGKVLLEMEIY